MRGKNVRETLRLSSVALLERSADADPPRVGHGKRRRNLRLGVVYCGARWLAPGDKVGSFMLGKGQVKEDLHQQAITEQ